MDGCTGTSSSKNSVALKLKNYLESKFKRVLSLWAPTILWSMLARGDIDGIVFYNSEGDDLYSGIIMAEEAGAIVMNFNGEKFTGMNSEPYIIACHPNNKKEFQKIVQDGLKKPI